MVDESVLQLKLKIKFLGCKKTTVLKFKLTAKPTNLRVQNFDSDFENEI